MRLHRLKRLVLVVVVALLSQVMCDTVEDSRTVGGRIIHISMNKVWPFSNPTETYRYYDFPFCQPEVIQPQWMSFGQVLRGDRLVNSVYDVIFRKDVAKTQVCQKTFTEEDIEVLKAAVEDSYMFELFVEGLPVVRPVGAMSIEKFGADDSGTKERYFLLNYFEFSIGYNDRAVVSVNMTADLDLEHLAEITDVDEATGQLNVPFYYSVKWVESPITASEALEKQMKAALMSGANQPIDIHILAIINSFVLIMLILSLLLLVIIRVVRSDLSRYLAIPDEELAAVEEETGWKLLYADVFRPPVHRLFLSAAVGAGTQLLLALILVVIVGCIGFYYRRGAMMTAGVICYLITAASGGYVSARLYNSLGGEKWAWNIFVTAIAFMGPSFGIWMFLNTVAITYNSTAAWPFATILFIITMWACVTFPLTVIGGIAGRHKSMKKKAEAGGNLFPCKTNKLAREIPSCRWYQSSTCQMVAGGFLPFSAIYIELHYVFSSVWGPKLYTLYGILLLACLLVFLVAAAVTVLFTYFQLNVEDHRWWWRSFISGGSVSAFFYAYCFYYYFQTSMTGLLQLSFYFLYSLIVAYAIFLMLGTASFIATYYFVWYIYSRIKID
ncbi:hypothetical protein FOZ61_009271 [Perkinsus olseni]|uniref:Transmembrane 9 superfamily member n=1 Tax=Perkinsus olseni TaxID=32597 RepID=A0A7J6L1F4_PEROL|nr:hypothetical protein FOZ61_009271 [Perkinsus olseni]